MGEQQFQLHAASYLKFSIERDCVAMIWFQGKQPTQAGVDKLIAILTASRECFEPMMEQVEPDPLPSGRETE